VVVTPGLVRPPFQRSKRAQHGFVLRMEILLVLAGWILASLASAQAAPGPSRIQRSRDRQPAPAIQPTPAPVLPQAAPAPPTPAPVPVVEEAPPQPPTVTWDGKQLTIDAENSTLTSILLAVRDQTGASVEIPASASAERVALHIGPAPIRDVLSSLLYGTNFDYIIQAADDDPNTLRSLIVTAGGMENDGSASDGAVVAAAPVKTPGMRMMPGWAAPGKPAFQAAAEAALAAERAATEGSAEATTESAGETAPQTQVPGSSTERSDSASAGSPPTSSDSKSAGPASGASSADGNTMTVSDIPPHTAPNAASGGNSGEQSEVSQRIQDMMRMFEQRRQIQAQQNQATATPANN
jgi:hypothetical protein